MRGPLSAYESADKKVVKAACERLGILWKNPVAYTYKSLLSTETGLSISNVERALTNIRKGYR